MVDRIENPFAPGMQTPEQKLRLTLRQALSDGRITSEEQALLQQLQAELAIPPETAGRIFEEEIAAMGSPTDGKLGSSAASSSGGQNIGEGNVIKGDISNTTGAASVGSIHISIPGAAGGEATSHASLLECPLCGRRNKPDGIFRCRLCGQDHLCLDHFDAAARACVDCVAKDESLRAEAERKHQAERETAEAEARRKAAAQTLESLELDCGNGATMKFALIPKGDFVMGSGTKSPFETDDEKPQHRVTITRPFYMGVYPTTQAQYRAIMGASPGHFKDDLNPVEEVSWLDAERFCGAMSARTGRSVRLPTEAEWEYACRAGTTTRYSFGDDEAMLGRYAWFKDNSGGKTHPVGQKQPNPWGLYDMHGNVLEWCSDWYAKSYANAGEIDPRGPISGKTRVVRGGAWGGATYSCLSAGRLMCWPGGCDSDGGFRVVVDLK
jgi:formylglycine-generating enzyme required for sulfatase activity